MQGVEFKLAARVELRLVARVGVELGGETRVICLGYGLGVRVRIRLGQEESVLG